MHKQGAQFAIQEQEHVICSN